MQTKANIYVGFTLIEMMLVLAIVSVLLLVAQNPVLEYHKIAVEQQQTSMLKGDVQRFLMMFKTELLQAGYALSESAEKAIEIPDQHSIIFQADRNHDGDLEDTREKIAYRFEPLIQTIKRKSGKGAYQTLIEPVYQLTFENFQQTRQNCVKIYIQLKMDEAGDDSIFCQFTW